MTTAISRTRRSVRYRNKSSKEHQVENMRLRVWREYKESAFYWTLKAWESTLKAFNNQCADCGRPETPFYGLTMDHYWPGSKGGLTKAGNIVPSCRSCNSAKGDLLPWQFCGSLKHERISAILSTLIEEGELTCRKTSAQRNTQSRKCDEHTAKPILNGKFQSRKLRLDDMAITAEHSQNNGTRTPAPAGMHAAICVDVVDRGLQTSNHDGEEKTQHKISIHWLIDKLMEDGRPFIISKWFTLSMHERSSLRPFVEEWLGESFDHDEAARRFDLESLVGSSCVLSIVNYTKQNGQKSTKVKGAMPFDPRFGEAPDASNYVRFVDRENNENNGNEVEQPSMRRSVSSVSSPPITDERIDQIWNQADLTWGGGEASEIELGKMLTKPLEQYTMDESAGLLDKLRSMPAKAAVPVRRQVAQAASVAPRPSNYPPAHEDEDNSDPFGDQ